MNIPVFAYILIKLASRCNINCSYCYWFRDEDVYRKPSILTPEVEVAFCDKLKMHILDYGLDTFTVLFHGGEPLLFPKKRFIGFMMRLEAIEEETDCSLEYIISTNGTLIDREWAEILKSHNVGVSVSLDGPADMHDKFRKDFKGNGTYGGVIRGIELLRNAGIEPGVISVCDPDSNPKILISHIVDNLKIERFDILPPDATHEDKPQQIGEYFIKLFDTWYDHYATKGVRIRILDGIVQGLIGTNPVTDSCGYGPVHTVTLLTDGSLEPLDVLRISHHGSTKTALNIVEHTFQDVQHDAVWMTAYKSSLQLCDTCVACDYADACGGGHLAHRWSRQDGFNNPSVYCESWKQIFDHTWQRIAPTLIVNGPLE